MQLAHGAHATIRPFTRPPHATKRNRRQVVAQAKRRSDKQAADENEQSDLFLKAIWGLSEAGGDLRARFLGGNKGSTAVPDQRRQQSSISRDEAVAAIREDWDDVYFVSGRGKLAAYDPDCLFKDDFASFRGVDRFKRNVSNFGGLTEDVDLKSTSWDERGDSLKVGIEVVIHAEPYSCTH